MEDDMEIVNREGESVRLPPQYKNISLDALRISARKKLGLYLNITSDISNDISGIVSDYNGLAEMIGFGYLQIQNFARHKNPTEELLAEWSNNPQLQPTLGTLWDYLIELGRIDVLEDCRSLIIRDAEAYLKMKEKLESDYQPVQENMVGSSTETAIDHHVNETLLLCRDDVDKKQPQHFDAFICYNPEGEDLKFVKKMINTLEKEPHNLKLFVPWRDDLPGGARYVIDAKLIESRCRRMVIIMSRNYQMSAACDFQVKFAHALSPGARSKKLIPVLIEPNVQIPQVLRHVTLCDYTKRDLMDWFWDRLSKAIKAPLDPAASGFGLSKATTSSSSSSSSVSLGSISSSPSSSSLNSSSSIPQGILGFNAQSHNEVRSQLQSLSTESSSSCPLSSSSVSYSVASHSNSSGFVSIDSGIDSMEFSESAATSGTHGLFNSDIKSVAKKTEKAKKAKLFTRLFGSGSSSKNGNCNNNTSTHC